MTRRIVLELANVTDSKCYDGEEWCDHALAGGCPLQNEGFVFGNRSAECLAAERAAAEMVRISPPDAEHFSRSAWAAWLEMPADARKRIYEAMSEHAKLAKGET